MLSIHLGCIRLRRDLFLRHLVLLISVVNNISIIDGLVEK